MHSPNVLKCRRRWGLAARTLLSTVAYWAAAALVWRAMGNGVAALWIFPVPYVLSTLLFMLGNW